ncbi:MbeD/MobD family mobilization/exclusion protein [Intestinimonas sp. HCP28S3_D6]|uniref:MbeD/MobD family mobilization/exclusion protein n=1 Tax=Intestinimonas sp. HCP28S3_D6 TaxID=3438942 RepID=UPI003F8AC677
MDKKTGHILSAVVAAAVVVVFFRQNAALQDKVDQLSQQVDSLSHQLVDARYDLSDEIGTLRRDLEEEASLFSTVETKLGYENGALTLAVAVVPKELSAGETAQVALSTGETAVLTDDGAGRLSGTLTCSLRESLEPVVSLTAGNRTRRETLPTLWTNELFTIKGESQWGTVNGTSSKVLCLTFSAPENSALQPGTVAVEVRSAILDPTDQGSLLGTVEAVRQADGSWQADLSQYLGREGGYEYAFWLTLITTHDFDLWLSTTTGEGLTLRSNEAVATWQQSEDGTTASQSEGSFALFADFGEA